jgi:hypothetical protein
LIVTAMGMTPGSIVVTSVCAGGAAEPSPEMEESVPVELGASLLAVSLYWPQATMTKDSSSARVCMTAAHYEERC